MIKKLLFISITYLWVIGFSIAQESPPLLRYPSLNSDGSKVAFSFQGDIWTVSLNGELIPRRLTIHQAYEWKPKWSPNDQKIAFSSDRFGNDDIFVIEAAGSQPQRLTFHSTHDVLSSWIGNETLFFHTRRSFVQVERTFEFNTVPVSGGTPSRAMDALGFSPVTSPNGRFVAFIRGSCRVTRETYQGPANRDVWIYDKEKDTYNQITDFEGQDIQADWGDDQTLYFLSAKSGRYNIHSQKINREGQPEGNAEQITQFSDEGIRSFDVSADGKSLVLEQGTSLYYLKIGEEPQKLNIELSPDFRFDPVEYKNFSREASEFAISPNSKYLAFVARGEVFLTENDTEKSRTVRLTNNPGREMGIAWVNDSLLIFTSDRGGQFDLYGVKSGDKEEQNLFKSLRKSVFKITNTSEDEFNPIISPDGKKVVFRRGRGVLVAAEISSEGTLANETSLLDGWATPVDISWSPDSKWLAYALEDLNFNEEIYLHPADNSKAPVNVSLHPKSDYGAVWSEDGSKLGFLSTRNNGDADVWFVWLKKEDWEKTKYDWEELEDEETESDQKDEEEEESPEIKIDFEDIHERITQVTALPGNESDLTVSKDGETFYFVTNRSGRQSYKADMDLYMAKWDGSEVKPVTKGGQNPYGISFDKKGKNLFAIKSEGSLVKIDPEKGKVEKLPYAAKMEINYPAERNQIFEEAWRTLRDGFYDPNYHGQDWAALKEKYKSRAINASTERDFQDMFNFMLGELNASHMGLYGSDRAKTQNERIAYLGIEPEPLENGIRVKRVIPNAASDRELSKLNEGDIILKVDDEPVSASINLFEKLINKSGEKVLLEVQNSQGENREVVIRPSSYITTLLYEEWVKERKKLTEKYSGGQLGYIHIRGMNWTSFEEFERELTASGLGKKGIVIDVRYNGGGWTTDYLMSVLNVKQHAYTVPRGAAENLEEENQKFKSYYPFGERLPLASWTKPSIALCNENSYSNAEIFSHAYKSLDLGKLVGKPTFGAVISTGGRGLLDGSFVRLPYRGWYVLESGKNMENTPAYPDIILENQPDAKAKNQDNQLQRAVEELLKEIGE
ncbi:S41 family peptidase [Flexithrix dorotheae]|uniref:S41 family peptidase n=1 Tax=Flexithrix dorotheae TaxID=70993 RepID=UPI000380A484|nr:S41 family peptidase [Flexithrix dorotheae]